MLTASNAQDEAAAISGQRAIENNGRKLLETADDNDQALKKKE